MESPTREYAARDEPEVETTGEGDRTRLLPMLFVGSIVAMYVALGYAVYAVIAALV